MCFWWASVSVSSASEKKSTSRNKSTATTSDTTAGNVGGSYVTAKTGGLTSPVSCLLVNRTNKTLYLRDKVGAAYGGTRYKIRANSQIEVSPLQHTFFRMILYAIEEEAGSNHDGKAVSGNKEKKKTTDTNLTIDSDQMADYKKIEIQINSDGGYGLSFSPR